jgi:hypothetical protein
LPQKTLPNLETKFIVANTLLPLGKIELPQAGLFDSDITALQKDLAKIRHNYFTAKTLKTKCEYRDEDKNIRKHMWQSLKQTPGISPEIEQSMKKVVHWDLYNLYFLDISFSMSCTLIIRRIANHNIKAVFNAKHPLGIKPIRNDIR